MTHCLERLLNERKVLLADGATGSNFFAMGLITGDSPELWNVDHPDRVARNYRSFVEAGSDIILTNSFGGTKYRLKLHNCADRVHELNVEAAQIARQVAAEVDREVVVAGSMGPTGEILVPLGPLSEDDAAEAFAEQAAALKDGGADVLWIETMSSREEVRAAVRGAATVDLPIIATFSVDTNGRTMMGLSPADIVELSQNLSHPLFAIGANCGVGASELVAAVVNMRTASAQLGIEPIIISKANCGIPQYVDGQIEYTGTPEIMREYIRLAVDAGANIIGGCCGTTPAHIAAMREALDNHEPQGSPRLSTIESKLGEVSAGAQAQLRGDLSIAAGAVNQRAARKTRRRGSA